MLSVLKVVTFIVVRLLFIGDLFNVSNGRIILETDYQWKTGPWELCQAFKNGCGEGNRTRPIWCQNEEQIEKVPPEFCKDKPKPKITESCFIDCRRHKGQLEWKVGNWGPCLIAENQIMEDGIGLMERSVTCVYISHTLLEKIAVDSSNCELVRPKPETIKTCNLPFTQDCITTDFTRWSPCCDGYQYRTRTILKEPKVDGKKCPELVEWKTCDTPARDCIDKGDNYRWKLGEWSPCVSDVPEGLSAKGILLGQGKESYYKFWPQVTTQTRAVECFNFTGEIVEKCYCGKVYGLPITSRACEVNRDCVVGPWSPWKTVQRGCVDSSAKIIPHQMVRHREILSLPEGDGLRCPNLVDKRYLTENLPFCVDLVKWQTSKWSDCLEPITNKKVDCGGGLQFRNMTCIDVKSKQPLPSADCRVVQPPPTIQRCEMACPRDCEVGPWSSWGPCLPVQCSSESTGLESSQIGTRKRFRNVVVPPSKLGMDCPSLSESQPCKGTQCFMWSAGTWGSCQLLPVGKNSRKCGPGKRTRQVFCITHQKEIVEESKCKLIEKPKLDENCTVPCPDDCVASSWSDWSPCSKPCSDSHSTGIRYRNRTIIAPFNVHRNGICPIANELHQIEQCNTHNCDSYGWLTMPWQKCNGTCGQSDMQYREVWCLRNNDYRVEDSMCDGLPKPISSRRCIEECEPECKLTEWSPWSKCPENHCAISTSDDFLFINGKYHRRRTRISYYNVVCDKLEEIELCPRADEECPNYDWAIGTWTECQLPKDARCGRGLRTRDISCVSSTSKDHVEMRLCLNSGKKLPQSSQECYIDCLTSCQSTEWSAWTSCYEQDAKERTRTRELIGGSENHSACSYISLKETEPCYTETYYNEILGDWSPCIINDTSACGSGFRYRRFGCFNKGSKLEPSICGYLVGLERDYCTVPCPQDCQLGEWTEWSPCSSVCGPGTQTRERQVIQAAAYGGRKCGAVWEQKPCTVPCSNFQWQTESWTDCEILTLKGEHPICGTGHQKRKVWCTDVKTGIHVDDVFCDWTTKPELNSTCHIICPGDCVLSEWSEWSTCSKGCPNGEQQQRTRALLRNSGPHGEQCPHSIQTRPCELNKTCFTYQWAATPFSSCLPLGGSPCGEGMITRIVYCQRSDGRAVDNSFCDEQLKPSVEEKWCYIDCPVDCEFGGWSDWNITKCTCNDTAKSRRAFVKTNPSLSGRECPANNEQWMPCPVVPCYRWRTSQWSHCELHGASCGHGIITRDVTCTRVDDRMPVESKYCDDQTKPSNVEKCFVPCIIGCQLASWTEWSPCHGDCRYDRIGYASRARQVIHVHKGTAEKPCPDPLWETRDCEILSCPSYEWKISPTGKIICVRSDGVNVTDGCDESLRPKFNCISFQDRCICDGNIEVKMHSGACPTSLTTETEAWISKQRTSRGLLTTSNAVQLAVAVSFFVCLIVVALKVILCCCRQRRKML